MPRSPVHVHQNLRVTCCHHLKVTTETMKMEALYQPETSFTTCQKVWGRHNSKYSNMNEHLKKCDSEDGNSAFLRNSCNHARNQKTCKLEHKHRNMTSASDTSAFLHSVCHIVGFRVKRCKCKTYDDDDDDKMIII